MEQYLYNVFTDPEIRTLPPALSWAFKRPLAWAIARSRSDAAIQSMNNAGGAPQLSTVQAQARALQNELDERGVNAKTFIAMRYWKPYAEDAVEAIKAEGIQKLVILPLYRSSPLHLRLGVARARADALHRSGLPDEIVGRARVVQPARLPRCDV